MDDRAVMDQAMAEARAVAEQLVERRVKGIQKVVARKDREIAELRKRLAEYEQPQEEANDGR